MSQIIQVKRDIMDWFRMKEFRGMINYWRIVYEIIIFSWATCRIRNLKFSRRNLLKRIEWKVLHCYRKKFHARSVTRTIAAIVRGTEENLNVINTQWCGDYFYIMINSSGTIKMIIILQHYVLLINENDVPVLRVFRYGLIISIILTWKSVTYHITTRLKCIIYHYYCFGYLFCEKCNDCGSLEWDAHDIIVVCIIMAKLNNVQAEYYFEIKKKKNIVNIIYYSQCNQQRLFTP